MIGNDNKARLLAAVNKELAAGATPETIMFIGVQMITHAAASMLMPEEAVIGLVRTMLATNNEVPLGTVRH